MGHFDTPLHHLGLNLNFKEVRNDQVPFKNSRGSHRIKNVAQINSIVLCFDPFFSFKFQVNDSIQRQEGILKEMTEVNGKFLGEKGGKDNGNARDDMLKKLAAAHDAFFELQKHLQEGTKFYNDLTQLLVTFQNKVSVTYLIRMRFRF